MVRLKKIAQFANEGVKLGFKISSLIPSSCVFSSSLVSNGVLQVLRVSKGLIGFK